MAEEGGGARRDRMRKILDAAFDPAVLEIVDVSHEHTGHSAVVPGVPETHFQLTIASASFEGKTLLQRHRLVYDVLQEELQKGLHALSITAKTPPEITAKK